MIQCAITARSNNATIFVVDAALLFEAGYREYFNSILFITAPKPIRYQRILLRKNIPQDQIEKRMALQMPEEEKKQLAHFTIENSGNISKLFKELEIFYENIRID